MAGANGYPIHIINTEGIIFSRKGLLHAANDVLISGTICGRAVLDMAINDNGRNGIVTPVGYTRCAQGSKGILDAVSCALGTR